MAYQSIVQNLLVFYLFNKVDVENDSKIFDFDEPNSEILYFQGIKY